MKKIKLYIDICMSILFLIMMGYHLFLEDLHEYVGIGLFFIVVLHQGLNRAWYLRLCKGKYTYIRLLFLVINSGLWIAFIAVIMSGVLISNNFSLFGIHGASLARKVHLISSSWSFIGISLHAGLHGKMITTRIRQHVPIKLFTFLKSAHLCLVIFGLYAFYQRGMLNDMFMLVEYKFLPFNEPIFLFLVDYFAIFSTFAYIGYLFTLGNRKAIKTKVPIQ